MIGFTNLELAALKAIFEETPELTAKLIKQLHSAGVSERRNSGVGFFTTIQVSESVESIRSPRALGHITHARVEGLTQGLGFVLFMADGRLHLLEAYALGGEATTNLQLDDLEFEVMHTPYDA